MPPEWSKCLPSFGAVPGYPMRKVDREHGSVSYCRTLDRPSCPLRKSLQGPCRATPWHPEPPPEAAPPALSPWPPPALPHRHRCTTAPLMAHPAIKGLRLAGGCRGAILTALRPCCRGSKASQGPPSHITRNYPQPVGCPARARIIFVMRNAVHWWQRPRPPWLSGCAGSRCAARSRLARLPPVRPRRGLPERAKKGLNLHFQPPMASRSIARKPAPLLWDIECPKLSQVWNMRVIQYD